MRTLHKLRLLRRRHRVRNFDPLSVLSMVQKAGQIAQAADNLKQAPQQLNQIGQAAQSITDTRLAERLSHTASELTQTARWIKYAAIGGVGVASMAVLRRAFTQS